jgi:tripartite-type tricarboxylate transporter receptor subunit TctC
MSKVAVTGNTARAIGAVCASELSAEVACTVQLPDVAQRLQLDGAEAVGSAPRAFAAFLKAQMQKWSKVIRDAGIKPEQ